MDIPSPGSPPSAPDSDLKVRVAGKTLQVRGCVAGHVVVWVWVWVCVRMCVSTCVVGCVYACVECVRANVGMWVSFIFVK